VFKVQYLFQNQILTKTIPHRITPNKRLAYFLLRKHDSAE